VAFAVVTVSVVMAFAVGQRGGRQQQGEDQYGCDYRRE